MDSYYENKKDEAIKDIMLKVNVSEKRANDIYLALYDNEKTTPGYIRLQSVIDDDTDHNYLSSLLQKCANMELIGNILYIYLSEEQYLKQLSSPSEGWFDPCSSRLGEFDDAYYDALHYGN